MRQGKWNSPQQACEGKLKHRSGAEAYKRLRIQTAKRTVRRKKGKRLHAYRCPYCGFWHVGSSG